MAITTASITLPTSVSNEILQKAQEESAIMRLSRHVTLPGNGLTIPVIAGDPAAAWVTEATAKPVSDSTLSTKVMQVYKLAVIEAFSDEFRRNDDALYEALISRLPGVLGAKFDNTVIGATNAPGSNFDTFASCTAQSILPGSGGTGVYAGLVAADTDIATHGGILSGFALGAQARGILLAATDTTGRPLFVNSVSDGAVDRILGVPSYFNRGIYKAAASSNPAVVGVAGDWSKALYGTVEGVKIAISDQATLTSGNTTINLWQQNMFAVRAEIEVGFRADLECFNLLTGATA